MIMLDVCFCLAVTIVCVVGVFALMKKVKIY